MGEWPGRWDGDRPFALALLKDHACVMPFEHFSSFSFPRAFCFSALIFVRAWHGMAGCRLRRFESPFHLLRVLLQSVRVLCFLFDQHRRRLPSALNALRIGSSDVDSMSDYGRLACLHAFVVGQDEGSITELFCSILFCFLVYIIHTIPNSY